eukprot:m.57320 g.57320  ORF g.57320 m.57320 type:complete len:64 (+) comp17074_c0_seq1:283-474(+)
MMDEEDVALWGIGGILICLFFTCYAIITKDLRRRTVALLTGTVVTTLWAVAFWRRWNVPDEVR